jgi:hypothetical protein
VLEGLSRTVTEGAPTPQRVEAMLGGQGGGDALTRP